MNFLAFAPQQGGDSSSQLISTMVMFGAMIVVFYFFIIRPQSKRQKDLQALTDGLKQGDKVLLSSGIHGSVSSVDEKSVMVVIADNVKVRVEKSAIATVLPKQ